MATASEPQAFGTFYRRHVRAVLAYLVGRTRRAELAADRARADRAPQPARNGQTLPTVRSLTIRTPRDVRTLIPEGPTHSFIAVYPGDFVAGKLTVTARLDDGTTRTQTWSLGGV